MVTERLKTIITQDMARLVSSTGPGGAAGKEVGEGAASKEDGGGTGRGLGDGEVTRPASTTASTRIPDKSSAIPPPSDGINMPLGRTAPAEAQGMGTGGENGSGHDAVLRRAKGHHPPAQSSSASMQDSTFRSAIIHPASSSTGRQTLNNSTASAARSPFPRQEEEDLRTDGRGGQGSRQTGTRPTGTGNATGASTQSGVTTSRGENDANASRTAATPSARPGGPTSSPTITATARRKKIPQRAGEIPQSAKGSRESNQENSSGTADGTRRTTQGSGHAGPSRDPKAPKDRSSGTATHASGSNLHDRHRQVHPSIKKRKGAVEAAASREAVVVPKVEESEESEGEEQVQPGKVVKVRNHPRPHMFRDTDAWIYASFCRDRSVIVVSRARNHVRRLKGRRARAQPELWRGTGDRYVVGLTESLPGQVLDSLFLHLVLDLLQLRVSSSSLCADLWRTLLRQARQAH